MFLYACYTFNQKGLLEKKKLKEGNLHNGQQYLWVADTIGVYTQDTERTPTAQQQQQQLPQKPAGLKSKDLW